MTFKTVFAFTLLTMLPRSFVCAQDFKDATTGTGIDYRTGAEKKIKSAKRNIINY